MTPQTRAERRDALIAAGAIQDDRTIPEDQGAFSGATPNRWVPSPEVRTWIYSIVGAVVPLLVVLGILTADVAGHVLNIAAAVLVVGAMSLASKNTPKSRE